MEINTSSNVDLRQTDSKLLSANTDFVEMANLVRELTDTKNQNHFTLSLLVEARLRMISVMIAEKVFEKSGKDADMEQFRGGKRILNSLTFQQIYFRWSYCSHSLILWFI